MNRTLKQGRCDPWPAQASHAIAPVLRGWLRDTGSLTARVRARCTHFAVRVRFEGRACLARDERAVLGGAPGGRAWVREVLLLADGVPVVFARSVVRPEAMRGAWRLLDVLGTRPLGAVLFADPRVVRGALHYRRLSPREARCRPWCAAGAHWARRRAFIRQGHVLLVTELFLPALLQLAT